MNSDLHDFRGHSSAAELCPRTVSPKSLWVVTGESIETWVEERENWDLATSTRA